jgi:hypothetical protein
MSIDERVCRQKALRVVRRLEAQVERFAAVQREIKGVISIGYCMLG